MQSPVEHLAEYFAKFPGIGPRQAKRFVYYLLSHDPAYLKDFARAIVSLKEIILQCSSCFRYFQKNGEKDGLCDICHDEHTDSSTLLVVEKDVDFENVRKSGSYTGMYFILGGALAILEKNPSEKIRAKEIFNLAEKRAKNGELKEIILATNATPEGENTALYVSKILELLAKKYNLKISTLGRGLSTGSEIEYSDAETFKSALESRR